MRETQVLLGRHIGRLIREQWFYRGKVKIIRTSAKEVLKNRGHEVTNIKLFLNLPRRQGMLKSSGLFGKAVSKNENQPDYKGEPCLIFRDENVPIVGLDQAKALTNTVELCEGLPETVVESEKKLNLSDDIHSEVQKKIKLSCMFEATQGKLPKRKDPLRPAWVFPVEYGIIDSRKNELLCKNLATMCEQLVGNVKNKSVILDALFSTPVKAHNKLILFELTSELVVTSGKNLRKFAEPSSTHGLLLPELHPLNCTVGLNSHHFHVLRDIYPMSKQSKWPYVQLAFAHYNATQVKNVTGEPVTESQIQARSLLKGFTVAVAEARELFGSDIEDLPEPVVVPVVHTDGKMFHFTIFQLNTLDFNGKSKEKNIFWNSLRIPLYESCEYRTGRPVLTGYNEEVIRKLITFYNIQ